MSIVNLTVEKWNNVYEHLFGGFETLADNEDDDDEEEDELDNVPSIMKTKDGYLKDGFIIEDVLEDGASDSDDNDDEGVDDVENSDHDDNGDEKYESSSTDDDGGGGSDDSSELTSEEYDYSDSESGSDSGSDPTVSNK